MSNAGSEVYPMAMFPTFEVTDVRESINWYINIMEFVLIYEMPDPDGKAYTAHVRKDKYQDIILIGKGDRNYDGVLKKGVGIAITLQFSDNENGHGFSIDDYASRIRAAGANVLEGPVNRPWNTRELVVADPDGYRLIFSAPRKDTMKNDHNETRNTVRGTLFKSN